MNIEKAKKLLAEKKFGIFSTYSIDVPGYPFGSVVPYCLSKEGFPVLLLSALAQHTKNIAKDPKVSLTVTDACDNHIQDARRVTYVADALKVENRDPELSDIEVRYYSLFPDSRNYREQLDFIFYKLKLVRLRYIGGFGEMFWIEPADYR